MLTLLLIVVGLGVMLVLWGLGAFYVSLAGLLDDLVLIDRKGDCPKM